MSPARSPTLLLRKPDEALVELAREGNDTAFGAIVARYGPELHRHCRVMLRDARAEDAVQQTFIRALVALRSGTDVRELRPWLHRIARNVALRELGATGWDHVELDADWEDPARVDEVDSRDALRAALVAIETLPERQRTALLRAAGGENVATIAAALGVSAEAARQLVHRARVTVRAAARALVPPPLVWFARRVTAVAHRAPAPSGVTAGFAPVAPKIVAVAVIGAAAVAAPAALIHGPSSRPEAVLASASASTAGSNPFVQPVLAAPGGGGQGGRSPLSVRGHGGPAPFPVRVSASHAPPPTHPRSGGRTGTASGADPTATAASTCGDPTDPSCSGNTGNTGNTGTGNTGNTGSGNTGNPSDTGNTGSGNTGNTGTPGNTGSTGNTGIGNTGAAGSTGNTGVTTP